MIAIRQGWYVLLSLILILAAPDGLSAQDEGRDDGTLNDRRQWNRPLFLPNSNVPSATVRRLGFEPGTTGETFRFYSAGEDKVVRTWSVTQTNGNYSIDSQEKIRWPLVKNDYSGLINAYCRRDYGTNLRLLAFGGWGVPRQAIQVVNLAAPDRGQFLTDSKATNYQVFSLDFHPTDPILAACLNNGKESRIAIWKLHPNEELLWTTPVPEKLLSRVKFSPRGDRLATADRAPRGQLTFWRFIPEQLKLIEQSIKPEIGAIVEEIAWIDDQTWVAASRGRGLVQGKADTGNFARNLDGIRIRNATRTTLDFKTADPQGALIASLIQKIAPDASIKVGDRHLMKFQLATLKFLDPRIDSFRLQQGASYEIRELDGVRHQLVDVSWNTAMAGSADGGLFAFGCYDIDQLATFGNRPGTVSMSSYAGTAPRRLEQADFDGIVSAVAVSDDKKYVLAAGTNRSTSNEISGIEIRLWSAVTGKLLATFPSREQLKTSSGSIAQLEHDRLSDGRNLVRFSRGPFSRFMDRLPSNSTPVAIPKLSHAFQLTSPNRVMPDLKQPRSKLYWTIGVQANANKNHVVWKYTDSDVAKSPELRREFGPFPAGSPASPVHPDLAEFGVHLCAKHFITNSGDQFLAIGYERAILIWDVKQVKSGGALNRLGFGPAICRGFVGHDGNTTCLSVDDPQNAKLLISGSDDGTICGWSLDGLQAGTAGRNELGVTFEIQEQGSKLVVKQVNETKPGYTAGFSIGQEVMSLDFPLWELAKPPRVVPQDRAEWKRLLEAGNPGERLIAEVGLRTGSDQKFKLQSNLLQQPLWTLYPWNDGQNWVIWSPEGYFVAPEGSAQTIGKSIGWQINSPLRFNSAEAYWELYQSNLLFNDLLKSHNKQRFLAKVHDIAPPINVFPSRISVPRPPPSQGTEPLRFQVNVERAGDEKVSRVQFWCNGRLREFQGPDELAQVQKPAGLTIEIEQQELRSEGNLITAVVESEYQDQILYNQKTLDGIKKTSNPSTPKRPPELHYLGIGVTKLEHEADWKEHDLNPLKYAANDVAGLAHVLHEMTGKDQQLLAGRFRLLLHADSLQQGFEQMAKAFPPSPPSKQEILAALKQLVEAKPPAPDDLLVIHLAGHGLKANVGDAEDEFFFVTQDADGEFSDALSWTELEGYLNKLSCKTLLLMDTCYAGAVLSPIKAQQNRILGAQIMTSSSDAQLSRESEFAGRVGGETCGQGLFTAAIIEALSGQQLMGSDGDTLKWVEIKREQLDSQNADGKLSIEELGGYVKRRVPELLKVKGLKYAADMYQDPQVQTSRSFATESTYLKPLVAN